MMSEKPWRAEAVMQFIALQLLCFAFGIVVISLLHTFGASGFKQEADFGNVLLGTLCFQGATWLLIPIFLRRHEMNWRDALGFRDPQLKSSLALAVAVLVLFIAPATWWWQEISAQTLTQLGWPVEDQSAITMFKGVKGWSEYAYLSLFTIAIAPVAEEFIFRGMLYPFVKQLGFPKLALFGTSFLFALIHADKAIFIPLFVLALALTWLYEKTDNLLAPITAHALFNAANLVVLCLVQNKSG
jgi:membrane protease YdiL (CAAX protease family)